MTRATDINPVLVEVLRGDEIESRHRGTAAVVDSEGRTVAAWGAIAQPVFPRSAVKPLQALALVESGAADEFGVSDAEIALACASHNGEPVHVAAVRAWLARLDLTTDALECGPHAPFDIEAQAALLRSGAEPDRAHNNCSGKHTGMLTAARHMGVPTQGYTRPDHPVQLATRAIMSDLASIDLSSAALAIDGCGVPTLGLPIAALARAMARFARPQAPSDGRAEAIGRIRRAMAAHPMMVAGRGRFCTEVMAAAGEAILVKTGAEGVFAAALPNEGLGIALKIDDGATRASECALATLLKRFAALSPPVEPVLRRYAARELRNWAGVAVGVVRPAAQWLS
jgi:L-asparaginase II